MVGTGESYCDKLSAPVGEYSTTVEETQPFVPVSHNGSRAIQMVTLKDEEGSIITFSGACSPLMCIIILWYLQANHEHELAA